MCESTKENFWSGLIKLMEQWRNLMNEKQRLLNVLENKPVDRPPVICPGGMMNGAVTEAIKDIVGNHNDEVEAMVDASIKVRELTGFENYGVPYCMTIESEPFKVVVDLGNKKVEPRIVEYNEEILEKLDNITLKHSKRALVVLDSIERLKNEEVPVIANITGPMSVVTSIIEPIDYYKMMRKDKKKAKQFLEVVTDYLIDFTMDMLDRGADLVAMSDPSATGEILGEKNFIEFMAPLYKKISHAVHQKKKRIIIHICGNSSVILNPLNESGADSLSFDSIVGVNKLKDKIKVPIMGNINTQLLDQGEEGNIRIHTLNSIKNGMSIISPACGLSMSTPIKNLKAMTDTVKGK